MAAEAPGLPFCDVWVKPLIEFFDEYRTQRASRGLKRPLTHESFCTGMASELLGYKVSQESTFPTPGLIVVASL